MSDVSEANEVVEERVAEAQAEDPKAVLRQAREMIEVGPRGIVPSDFAKQIDYARDLSRSDLMPPHARQTQNMLILLDIAIRSDLAPYQVASQTYVQNGVLNFMSQLQHAMLEGSRLLDGDLFVDHEGEGDDLVCIVTGTLSSDHTKRVWRSPRLADLHPGYSVKRTDSSGTGKRFVSYAAGQKMKAEGLPEGTELFPKGSPLWDRKPRMQIAYDTMRDWQRIFAPRATLGMYSPEEATEYGQPGYGPDFARDVTPIAPASALAERLAKAAEEGTGSGFHADVVEDGLNEEATAPQQPAKEARRRAKPPRASRTAVKGETAPAAQPAPAKRTPGKDAPVPTIEEQRQAKLKADLEASVTFERLKAAEPKNVKGYRIWLTAWLRAETDPDVIKTRWSRERSLRNNCGLTQDDREPLQLMIKERLEQLDQ